MTHLVSRSRRAVTTLLAGMALSGLAHAAGFSAKPITIVVAFPAGGDTDVLARILAEKLTPRLGQPVIVENRTGGSGVIGTTFVARSQPDGHTLLLAPNTIAITPHVLQTSAAKINPAQDLTPITQLASQSLFVVATAASGVSSVKELLASVPFEVTVLPGGHHLHLNDEAGAGLVADCFNRFFAMP